MSRSRLFVAFSFASLAWAFTACGGRSDVPGSDYAEPSPYLSGAAGATGKAGGAAKAGAGAGAGSGASAGSGATAGSGASAGSGAGAGFGANAGFGAGAGAPQTCSTCIQTTGSAQCQSEVNGCAAVPSCQKVDSCVKQLGCLDLGPGSVEKCVSQCGTSAAVGEWITLNTCRLCGSSCAAGPCSSAVGLCGGTAGCGPGQKCNPGEGCVLGGPGPECMTECSCGSSGTYTCTTDCGTGGCEACIPKAAPSSCPGQFAKCQQFPGCTKLFECMTQAGCHSASNPIACASKSGCSLPAGPATQVAAELSECAKCSCGSCPVSPGQCGAGGGTGGGTGQACGDCVVGATQAGACPTELDQCDATAGCLQLAQCAKGSGCMETIDPVSCAAQSCKGSPAAFSSFGQLFQCAGCGSCQAECLACGGGGSGGAGGGPPQSCDQCIEQNQSTCQGQINKCFASPECQSFLDCVQNGDWEDCQKKFPKGVPLYMDIIECLVCGACDVACQNEVPPGFCPDDL